METLNTKKKKVSKEEFEADLADKRAKIPGLKSQLTKRNEEFMYKFEREMETVDYEGELDLLYYFMLSELVEGQKTGKTAQQLYQTPKKWATYVTDKPLNGQVQAPFWQLAVDGGLLIGGIFALISGLSLFAPSPADSGEMGIGVLTLLFNFVVGGVVMGVISQNIPDPTAPKGQQGYMRYAIVSVIAIIIWLVLITAITMFVPITINPVLPAAVYVIIGILALLGKWYFKKTYKIKGGIL